MEKNIKVGVIGYGGVYNMARTHLEQMREAGMRPTAVTEINSERLQAAAADFPGIETYSSLQEMLAKSDVELITVVTPHNTHFELGLQCLKAGRHVICEKPMAITTSECDTLIATAAQRNLLLSTYHNRHWDGCILRAMKAVRSGELGNIIHVDLRMGNHRKPGENWRSRKSISGGILFDWGVHLLEYALQIFVHKNDRIVEVSGYASHGYWVNHGHPYPEDANEDEAQVMVRFASGARVNLMISSLDCNVKPGLMEIMGTRGNYVMTGATWEQYKTLPDGIESTLHGKNPPNEHHLFYKNIAAHLTQGEKLIVTPEWARLPIHILDMANQSALLNKALPVKYSA
jgi:predicted dehydrogenase